MARERIVVILRKGYHFVPLRKECRLSAEIDYGICEVEVFDPLDVHCNRPGCSPSGAFGVLFGHPWPSSLAEVTKHIPHRAKTIIKSVRLGTGIL